MELGSQRKSNHKKSPNRNCSGFFGWGGSSDTSGEPAAFQNSFLDKNQIIKKARTEIVQAFLVGVAGLKIPL